MNDKYLLKCLLLIRAWFGCASSSFAVSPPGKSLAKRLSSDELINHTNRHLIIFCVFLSPSRNVNTCVYIIVKRNIEKCFEWALKSIEQSIIFDFEAIINLISCKATNNNNKKFSKVNEVVENFIAVLKCY